MAYCCTRLESLWTAVKNCSGGSISSDWRLIGTYKMAKAKVEEDKAKAAKAKAKAKAKVSSSSSPSSSENAEPSTRRQQDRTFVHSKRLKETQPREMSEWTKILPRLRAGKAGRGAAARAAEMFDLIADATQHGSVKAGGDQFSGFDVNAENNESDLTGQMDI